MTRRKIENNMKQVGRLILNLSGEKSYFLWNGTDEYYKKLRSVFKDLQNDNVSDHLYFGFFTLCAATLEYSLDFVIADYCLEKFGPEDYKTYCEAYISLPFRKKLLMVPHIISDGEFVLNENCPSFKYLEELIILRNRILHNKEFLKEFDCPINGEVQSSNISLPVDKTEINISINIAENHINTLTKEKCLRYGNALGDFKKFIMIPALDKNLQENILISKNQPTY